MAPLSIDEFQKIFPFDREVESQIKALLKAAVRAPSTHNSQPWRFGITGNALHLYRDSRIQLPQSDPVHRYAHVSIGFLLHHVVILARWLSMDPKVTLVCSGDHIADISFSGARQAPDVPALIRTIFTRRNRRGEFDRVPIPQKVLDAATHPDDAPIPLPETRSITDPKAVNIVAEATAANMLRVYARRPFRREMSRWITPTGSRRVTGLPGYSLNQPLVLSWILPTMIRFINMGGVLAKLNRASIASAPALFGFGAPDEAGGWLSTGYAASHAALTLIASGYDYSVFVASIEYPDTRARAGAAFGLAEPLEFLFAAGKLPGVVNWTTPRAPLEDKMMT
jgi:hypothetical protein